MLDLESSFKLNEWTITPDRLLIADSNGTKHLEPKAMETLVYLAGHAGETVTREALIDEIWKDTYGSDEVLSRIISILRNQLGDSSRDPVFIETIPKVGYRLVVSPEPVEKLVQGKQLGSNRKLVFAAASLLALLLISVAYIQWGNWQPDSRYTVAVLPFTDESETQSRQFFVVGLTDEIIVNLSRSPLLKVVARSSLDGLQSNLEEADVDFYVEGTVRFVDDSARIFIQLISADEGIVVWSDTQLSPADEYLSIQRNLSTAIIEAMNQELGLDIQAQFRAEVDLEAYTYFLNGHFLSKLRGNEPLLASIEAFTAALAIEPSFDSARLGLANSYVLLPYYSGQNEDAAFTFASEQLGMLQQPDSAEAHAIRGFIAFRQWRWLESEQHFQRAINTQSDVANTHEWYSQLLSAVGKHNEAFRQAQVSYELDPVSAVANIRLANTYLGLDQDEEARKLFEAGASLGFVGGMNPGYLLLLHRDRNVVAIQQALRILHPGGEFEPVIQRVADLYEPENRQNFIEFSEGFIVRGIFTPRLEFPWWVILQDWERVAATIEKYAANKKNIDVVFLFAREAEGFHGSPLFSQTTNRLGLDGYWREVGGPDS